MTASITIHHEHALSAETLAAVVELTEALRIFAGAITIANTLWVAKEADELNRRETSEVLRDTRVGEADGRSAATGRDVADVTASVPAPTERPPEDLVPADLGAPPATAEPPAVVDHRQVDEKPPPPEKSSTAAPPLRTAPEVSQSKPQADPPLYPVLNPVWRDRFSPDRWNLLCTMYRAGKTPAPIREAMNELPGPILTAVQVENFIMLQVRDQVGRAPAAPPPAAPVHEPVQLAAQPAAPTTWKTPEREKVMRSQYEVLQSMDDLMRRINALPGPKVDKSWLCTWANGMKLKRPPQPPPKPVNTDPPAATSKLGRALQAPAGPIDVTTPYVTDMDTIRIKAGTWGVSFRTRADLDAVNAHARRIGHRPFAIEGGGR